MSTSTYKKFINIFQCSFSVAQLSVVSLTLLTCRFHRPICHKRLDRPHAPKGATICPVQPYDFGVQARLHGLHVRNLSS